LTEGSAYFGRSSGESEAVSGAARFVSVEREVPEVEAAPGVWMQPVFGDRLNFSLVRMEANSEAPVHEHAEEQIGFVLSGWCEFTLGDETRTLWPGEVYVAPPFVPHGARTAESPCRILDAFSPPREALRQLMEQSRPSPDTTE
jgi:quercetin dioxygenase-like cupin family protein